MFPGINEQNVQTLILLGLMVIAEEPARQQEYGGADVMWGAFPEGFHANMRDHFRETDRKIRNSLRHAKSGSVKLCDDGTVEWLSPQGKKLSLTPDELRRAYTYVMLASSEVVKDSIKVDEETGMISYSMALSTFGTPDSSPSESKEDEGECSDSF